MLHTLIHQLPIGWSGRLALQRLLSQWRSLLTIIAGTLLAAAVGALVPLYTTAVAQVSMVEKFNQLPVEQVNASASMNLIASQTKDFSGAITSYDSQFRSITDQFIGQRFPGWLNRVVFFGETSAFAVDPPPVQTEPGATPTIPDPTTRVYVAYYEGWQDAVVLADGRFPNDKPVEPGADIEIAIPFEVHNTLNINVGDVLLLDQGGPKSGWPTSKNVQARVVGIVNQPEQLDALQRAYLMPQSPLRLVSVGGDYQAEYDVLTTRSVFDQVATLDIPDTPTVFGWRLLFDHTRLPFTRSPEARQALFDYDHALAAAFKGDNQTDLQFNYTTGLINWQTQGGENYDAGALLDYERSVKTLDAPFGLLLLQVGALVLFFLLVTAALVRRGERREIAMLQSRGAMDRQIIWIRGVEAFLICLLAALLAPFVSQQLLIVITPFFARYSNLPLQIVPVDYVYSGVAAFCSFLALMFTLRPVLRLPLITSGGSTIRSEKQPWWQRYYLDVILVVLGIAALWRLVGKDTPLFTTTAGGRTTDPFLLLAPAFLFLGLGSFLLRLFPVIAATISRLVATGRGLIGALASWQLSREPVHYGRITFLLALAIGIGWFATSFRATVNRSQNDQAEYKVGTDVRFTERDMQLNAARARPQDSYTQVPGVTASTVTLREPNVNFQPDPSKDSSLGELLAVDSNTFKQVLNWRPDLGVVDTPRQPGQSVDLPERGVALPFVPQKLNLWADFTVPGPFGSYVSDLNRLRNRTQIFARLLDASGAWIRIPFKITEVESVSTGPQTPGLSGGDTFITDGWAYLEADLTALNYKPVAPVRLVSMYWNHSGRSQGGERQLRLTLAGLTGTDANEQKQPLNMFSTPDWHFAYDSGAYSEGSVAAVGYLDQKRGEGIAATWDQSAQMAVLGVLLNYDPIPSLPLIGSESLVAQLSLQPNQIINVRDLEKLTVPFRVLGSQHYYPTLYDAFVQDQRWVMDEKNHPFAITDRDSLLYMLNRRPSAALYADEVWLKTAPGVDQAAVLKNLRPEDRSATIVTAMTVSGELSNLQTDPLSLGLLGLMFLAFIIAMTLSIVGLLTYATLTAVARRSEFGVLRALGMSSVRLVRQLAFEQIFVLGLGTLLGGLLGAVLSSQVVPRLAQDASSKSITPPFIVQVETAALMQYGAVIFGVLVLVLFTSLLLVRQLSLTQTLRLGEE